MIAWYQDRVQYQQPAAKALIRPAMVIFCLLSMLGGLALLPISRSVKAPVAIRYLDSKLIHNAEPGFVVEAYVNVGQMVKQGDVLLRLRSPELQSKLAAEQARLASSRHHGRRLHAAGDVAQFRVELAVENAIAEHVWELQKRTRDLVVRAPIDGVILDGDWNSMGGQYLRRGAQLCRIGNPGSLELTALVPDDLVIRLGHADEVEGALRLAIAGRGREVHRCVFRQSREKANDSVHFEELTAAAGGTISLKGVESPGGPRLWRPHVKLTSIVKQPKANSVLSLARPGHVGCVRLSSDSDALYQVILRAMNL